MNIRNFEIKKKTKKRPFLIFFIIYTIVIFLIEIFYRDALFEYSIDCLRELQKGSRFDDMVPIFEYISTFFGTYRFYTVALVLIYNYANVYKSFILMNTYMLSIGICSLLKIIYHTPVMYYSDNGKDLNLHNMVCYAGYGSPPTSSVTTTALYLALWRILFSNSRMRFKRKTKIGFLIVAIIIILFINLCKFFAGLFSLNEILFGLCLGFMIYFLIFHIIKVRMNNGRLLVSLINTPMTYYLMLNILILGIYLTVYYTVYPNSEEMNKYTENINQSNCSYLPQNKRFKEESLIMFVNVFTNLGIIIGLKCEYFIIFGGNEANWRLYNFSKEENEDDSLLSRLSIARESQWNHTAICCSLIRLVLICMITTVILLPNFMVNNSANLLVVIFFKFILPWNTCAFFMFFVNKFLFKRINLANDAVFTLTSDILL
jgi:hypothetical protein